MRGLAALLVGGLVLSLSAAVPLPPIVEKLIKEGLPVSETQVTVVQSVLGKDADGMHLFKLLKDQTYGIELASPEFRARMTIEPVLGKMSLLASDTGKATFRAPSDGTYRLAVTAVGGGGGKYVINIQQFSFAKLKPGVLVVGPNGINVADNLNNADQPDRVRRHLCKVYEVQMVAGKTYTIDLISQWDNYLRLEDENLKQLAEDDDSGGFPNARIIFRAPADGNYRVITTSFAGAVGPFTLKIRDN